MKASEPQGYLLLEGGAEFGGQMALADQRTIDLAGGLDATRKRRKLHPGFSTRFYAASR